MKFIVINSLVNKFEEKLNKFIKKYKQVKVIYNKSEPYICEDKTSPKYMKKVRDIEVEASYKISGWEFIAALEWKDDIAKNLIKQAPDTVEVPETFRYKNSCDHCNTNRNRRYTIILRNIESGEFKQVGKSCVKEYIGIHLTDYVSYLSMWDSLDEYLENLEHEKIPSYDSFFYIDDLLNQTCAEVRHRGYVSKAMAEKEDSTLQSTSSRMWQMYNQIKDFEGNIMVPFYTITEEDKFLTKSVIDYVKNVKENSSYIGNLKLLLEETTEDYANLGLVVSMVGFYLREQARIKEIEKEALNSKKSEHVGNVGDKIEFTATPEILYSGENFYGDFYMYKFIVDDNIFTWKTNKYLAPDQAIFIKGTIKSHTEYRNVKQTELTRCKTK